MTAVTGLRVVVDPVEALSAREREWLGRTFPPGVADGEEPPFRLHLLAEPPWSPSSDGRLPDGGPAALEIVEGRIRILHRRYLAEVDPLAGDGVLFRRRPEDGGLGVVLQTAFSSRLPLNGGLPLHAAGVVMDGRGLAFFGPSGAGKSTLAATFPGELLSDELVIVQGRPFELHASGFWGTLGRGGRSGNPVPLAAVVELGKGPAFALEPLDGRRALRRLMDAVLVPLHPVLWSAALGVLGRAVKEVPAYRMRWSPEAPPWRELEALLARPAGAPR